MDRDELKIKVRDAIWNLDSQATLTGHWEDPLTYAEAALTVIEEAGYIIKQEAAAFAVWDEAVEACAKATCCYCHDGSPVFYDDENGWGHNHPTIKGEGVDCEAWVIRSLKRSEIDDGCQSEIRADELRSEVDGLKAAINADTVALILSENEGASHGYLAVQICEKIEADAHEKHLSSEYMRSRPAKENTDV